MTDSTPEISETDGCPHLGAEYHPLAGPQLENPYPFYSLARKEEPVFFSEEIDAWVITRYEDARSILLQPHLFSSKDTKRPTTELANEVIHELMKGYRNVPTIINSDGQEHRRFRTLLNLAFSPMRMKAMREIIYDVTHGLIDEVATAGEADIMAQFAQLLPLEVILLLFGIPHDHIVQCRRWSVDLLALFTAPLTLQQQLECARGSVAFQHYIRELIEERREAPEDDLISLLLTTPTDERPLTIDELVNTVTRTILAGHETTANLIGNALYFLLTHMHMWDNLLDHPEICAGLIEEVLRYDAPVQTAYRTATQDTRIGDIDIAQGAYLLLLFGSANRDEAQFSEADQFDPLRSPNRHLTFGYGAHYCIGAPLARMEAQIALEVLRKRLPNLHLRPQQVLLHTPQLMIRGFTRLIVEWDVIGEYNEQT